MSNGLPLFILELINLKFQIIESLNIKLFLLTPVKVFTNSFSVSTVDGTSPKSSIDGGPDCLFRLVELGSVLQEIVVSRYFECYTYAGIPGGQYVNSFVTVTMLVSDKRGQDTEVMSAHA